ncbi:MAG: hypothetical protein ACRETN_12555 [Nevskiales bacterium]
MRRLQARAIWLLLALVLGQALFVLHAAQHPLAAGADYDCVICAHGLDGPQALAAPGSAVPVLDPSTPVVTTQPAPLRVSAVLTRPPIRGPPHFLA